MRLRGRPSTERQPATVLDGIEQEAMQSRCVSLHPVQADRQELIHRRGQADHRDVGHRRLREPPGTLGRAIRVASNAKGEGAPIHPGSGGSLVDDIGSERPDRHSAGAAEPLVPAGHHEIGAPGAPIAPHRTGPLGGVEDEPDAGLFGGRS